MNDNVDNRFAVIIAIEDYRFEINQVHHARQDAEAMKNLFISGFGLKDEQILVWINEQATRTALEQELPYYIRQLGDDSVFYFYYAGHGFNQNGVNRLTVWDSHPFNLSDTTVSINDVLLEPIIKSECSQSIMFIDSCATNLAPQVMGRDMLSDMNREEFEAFIRSGKFTAMYMSCSPGEKSYSSERLQHGIWTYHLLKALKGEAKEAITHDVHVTSSSLKDYLRYAVPEYITRHTEIRGSQIPWAQIASTNTFEIRRLPEPQNEVADALFDIKLKYDDMQFRKLVTTPISKLPGFSKQKRHFVPDRLDNGVTSFIQRLLEEELHQELKEIYERTKNILGLRRKEILKTEDSEGGNIDNEYFRFNIFAEQNHNEPSEAIITRTLTIRWDYENLPSNFDDIFPNRLDEIVIPLSGVIDFDSLVDRFEEIEESIGGRLNEDDKEGIIEFHTTNGLLLIVLVNENELVIKPRGKEGCLKMLEQAREGLLQISPSKRQLFE